MLRAVRGEVPYVSLLHGTKFRKATRGIEAMEAAVPPADPPPSS
jgi:hypothetical protein